jgi:anti-sigma B factor antagonist
MEPLEATLIETPQATILKVKGEARMTLQPLERECVRLNAAKPAIIVVDLSELTLISSLGMGMLTGLRRSAMMRGGKLKLAALQPLVLQSFLHARLTELFEIHATLDAALAQAASPAQAGPAAPPTPPTQP